MSTESQTSSEMPRDPLAEARNSFNDNLVGRDYDGIVLRSLTLQLQNVLLQSTLTPDKVYSELAMVANQAARRARVFEDEPNETTFRELESGYKLSLDVFLPKVLADARQSNPQPSQIDNFPLTGLKGPEAVSSRVPSGASVPRVGVNRSQRAVSTAVAPEVSSAEPQGETFGSFLRSKRIGIGNQKALADRIGGVPTNYVSMWETGKSGPKSDQLDKLVQALDLSEEDTQKLKELYTNQFPPKS